MPDFLISFADIAGNGVIVVHDTKSRKKPLAIGDNVRVHDEGGNAALGFIERHDPVTNLYWIAVDRSTYASAVLA